MTRDEYVASIKSAFVTAGTNGLYGILVAKAPIFASGVLGKIAKFFINKIVTALADLTEMMAFFGYIDWRTSEQADAFQSAAFANRKAQESGSDEDKKRAEENLLSKFREFAKFNS